MLFMKRLNILKSHDIQGTNRHRVRVLNERKQKQYGVIEKGVRQRTTLSHCLSKNELQSGISNTELGKVMKQ